MSTRPSPALQALVMELRQHPAFPELLKRIEPPPIPRFRHSQASEVEKARAEWIYASGKRDQHDLWLSVLTGEAIPRDAG